jgi:hypothetical protein
MKLATSVVGVASFVSQTACISMKLSLRDSEQLATVSGGDDLTILVYLKIANAFANVDCADLTYCGAIR